MLMAIKRKDLLMHLFFVSLFLIVPALVFQRLPHENLLSVTRVIVQDTTANFILLCFFYLNYYFLIPKFYFTHKYVQYFSLVFLFLSVAFLLPYLAGSIYKHYHPLEQMPALPGTPGPAPGIVVDGPGSNNSLLGFSINEFRRHLYLFFTAIFFSFLLRTREHLSQLKEEKLSAALSSLKAQINPHFLFNTLNSIYSLSIKKDERTSDAIINLASLMRYAMRDAQQDAIPLQEEFDYINSYVELQRARLGNTAAIQFDCTGDPGNKTIAPLILITYIENAFKYGINPDVEDCFVHIQVGINNGVLELCTKNKIVPSSSHTAATGIGMANTKERLQHLYPQQHTLQTEVRNETYLLNLTINLQ